MTAPTVPHTTAFLLLVGNELLTGKIEDLNGIRAAKTLRQHGVTLLGIEIVPDEIGRIAACIHRVLAELEPTLLIVSGGVGPTHDDVTIEAVARARDRAMVRDADLESRIRAHYGERVTPDALSMADVPLGCELLYSDGAFFPLFKLDNIYCLPGEPRFFGLKLAALIDRLEPAGEFFSARVHLSCDEAPVAAALRETQEKFPDVPIGSYPRFEDESQTWWTLITLDSKSNDRLDAALTDLLAKLPASTVSHVETE